MYRVVEVKDLKSDDGTFLFGQVKYSEQEIAIDAAMSPERRRATIWHEALHAIEDIRGLDLGEKTVITLGVALFELVRDNPWLAENLSPCPSPEKGGELECASS